jgi:hypothetical protein
MQRLLTCVVCGAEFLRPGGLGATCSTACRGWWRLENRDKGRSQAAPADALSPGAKRIIAKKARKVRGVLTPDGHFPSAISAARHHRVSEATVRLRISAEWPGWRYAEPYQIPAGTLITPPRRPRQHRTSETEGQP